MGLVFSLRRRSKRLKQAFKDQGCVVIASFRACQLARERLLIVSVFVRANLSLHRLNTTGQWRVRQAVNSGVLVKPQLPSACRSQLAF